MAKVPDGFVEVVVPERYGTLHSTDPDGKPVTYTGGAVAVLPAKQAAAIGAVPADAPKAAPARPTRAKSDE